MRSGGWHYEEHLDGVGALHGLAFPNESQRLVRWCVPDRSAVVLGSAQPDGDIRNDVADKLAIDVVRRRSGGGAVLVEPGDVFWVDVLIPPGDPLWNDDVGKAFYWLGDVWVDALQRLGIPTAKVHRGALMSNEWSRKICFAGLGPGEVTIDGRKAVGISQKRTRQGALFQCALLLQVRADRLAAIIEPVANSSKTATEVIQQSAVGVGPLDENIVRSALTTALE